MTTGDGLGEFRWGSRTLVRLLHVYFALSRGMTLGVRAACFDSRERVFLVRHSYVPGWHLPGGGVERGETALEALGKELQEEGNLVMTEVPQLFHLYFNPRISRRDHVLLYRVRVEQVAPRLADREIVEAGFFPLDALPDTTTVATRARLAEISGAQPVSHHW